MKITNEMGLPEAIYNAVSVRRHNNPGRLSATTLLNGIKQIHLTDRHWDELEEDVLDRFWAIFGTAGHKMLEHEGEHEFAEEFMSNELDGIIITGRIDNYNMKDGRISDYKFISKYKIKSRDFTDWERQGMIYAWLLIKNGFVVKTCRFIAIIKDHSKREARRDSSYPQYPLFVYEFDVTQERLAEIEIYLRGKITEYKKYRDTPDDEIPPCTPKERWDKPTKYAVMKGANKRATRVFETPEEAEKMISDMGAGYSLDTRPGESTRCQDYCSCCEYCNYYRDNVATVEDEAAAA